MFSEGLSLLELVYNLSPHSKEFKDAVFPLESDGFLEKRSEIAGSDREFYRERAEFHRRGTYRMAFQFMSRFVKTIEVVLDGHLQPLHFQQPLTAIWYVQEATKHHILEVVPFSSPDVKAKAFIQLCLAAHVESQIIRQLSRFSVVPEHFLDLARRHLPDAAHRPFQVFLANDARLMQEMLKACLAVGMLLAMHVGTFLVPSDEGAEESTQWSSPLTEKLAYSMGTLYFCSTLLWVAMTACIKLPINMQTVPAGPLAVRLLRSCVLLGQDVLFMWRVSLLIFCAFAIFRGHFWMFTCLLLDFFCQNALLATILLAIKPPIRALIMTFLGAGIVSFVYAAIGFQFFREEFGEYCNTDIYRCTQNILYQGTRGGVIGLSSMLKLSFPGMSDWAARWVFDLSFFTVYGIMILNTIVALIVDSFSQLRTDQEARLTNQQTQTFISCIDRKHIEGAAHIQGISGGFEHHEEYRQNKWDYMSFIFHLREKPLQDCTGSEQAIRNLLDAGDYKWIPLGRSLMIETCEGGGAQAEDQLQRVESRMKTVAAEAEESSKYRQRVLRAVADLSSMVSERLLDMQDEVE